MIYDSSEESQSLPEHAGIPWCFSKSAISAVKPKGNAFFSAGPYTIRDESEGG